MPNTDFPDIDNLHSEWSRMEKAARLGWLSGEKARLTGLANQFSLYIYAKGGVMNDSERVYARKLLDMINSVDAEGSKVMDDLRNDAFREIALFSLWHWNNKIINGWPYDYESLLSVIRWSGYSSSLLYGS